jgi:hypothetical protein
VVLSACPLAEKSTEIRSTHTPLRHDGRELPLLTVFWNGLYWPYPIKKETGRAINFNEQGPDSLKWECVIIKATHLLLVECVNSEMLTAVLLKKWNTRCGYEVPGMNLLQACLCIYSLPRGVTFEVLPLDSCAFSPTMLPLMETVLELLLRNSF